MSVQDLTNAIINGINDGGEQFMEGTLAAALPIIWLVILGLHLGRPYILDMIGRFTLRLGADLLWLIYVGVRDILIVTGVVMSFMFFFPDVITGNSLPLTGGLAAACLFAVLLVKLMGDPDHNLRDFRLVTGLLGLGALFYFVPLRRRCPGRRRRDRLDQVGQRLPRHEQQHRWAVPLTYISSAILAVLGAIAAGYTLKTGGRAEAE